MGSTVERLLVRTWNLFHGNTMPRGRKAYLEELVRLGSADGPDVLCVQELSVWGLEHLTDWSGMSAVADVARRPPPLVGELAHRLEDLDARRFRSAIGPSILWRPSSA